MILCYRMKKNVILQLCSNRRNSIFFVKLLHRKEKSYIFHMVGD